jgi:hypothetical protein
MIVNERGMGRSLILKIAEEGSLFFDDVRADPVEKLGDLVLIILETGMDRQSVFIAVLSRSDRIAFKL